MRKMNLESFLLQLCQAKPEILAGWLRDDVRMLRLSILFLIIGGAMYGASLGSWRAPLQAVYVAVKFPLLLGLTALGNALINGMLAQLMGAPMTFRQSLLAVLMSFALMAVIVGSFMPLSLFILHHLPAIGGEAQRFGHGVYLLINTILIAFAGTIANLQLYRLLIYLCGNSGQALRILFAWLSINLFLGAQLSWNLRPFFGSPGLPVKFLRDDPFSGSFYEAVFQIFLNVISGD